MSHYPEHEKLQVVQPQSQVCGAFLEWLAEQGYAVCMRVRVSDHPKSSEAWTPTGIGFNRLLADHFEIDLDKIEEEKRAMLKALNPDFA